MSWDEPGESLIKNYKQGDEVKAVILSIDSERERISLGLKQLEKDPFSVYVDMEDKSKPLAAKVISVNEKGVEVELEDKATGYIRVSELSVDRVEDPRTQFKVGDEIEAKFIGVDRKNSKLNLSIRALHEKEEKDVKSKKSTSKKADKAPEPAVKTLGDLIKEKMTKDSSASSAAKAKPKAETKAKKSEDKDKGEDKSDKK